MMRALADSMFLKNIMFVILINKLMLFARSSLILERIMAKVQKKVGFDEFNIISAEIYFVNSKVSTFLCFKALWFVG